MTAERTEAAITTSHNDKSPASIHKLLVQVASVEVVNKNCFSSIDFPIRLGVTHRYIRAVLVRCNIQRYSPL